MSARGAASRARAFRFPRASIADPIAGLLRATHRDREWLVGALVAAGVVHGLLGLRIASMGRTRALVVMDVPTELVEIDVAPPPPPAAEPPPEPPAPAPAAAPVTPVAPVAPASRDPAPSRAVALPAAARAAAVVTQQPDPNQPVDLGDGFVAGSADTYAGGATSANGTSANAVRGRPDPSGGASAASSAPRAAPPPGPDLSHAPALEGRADWRCPFPHESDEAQIDHAVVTLTVRIDAAGRVASVAVGRDPGHGFGREARRCAVDRRWTPAIDHDGAPVAGAVVINVRFDR